MKILYLVQIVQDIKDGGGSKPDTWLNCLRFEKRWSLLIATICLLEDRHMCGFNSFMSAACKASVYLNCQHLSYFIY